MVRPGVSARLYPVKLFPQHRSHFLANFLGEARTLDVLSKRIVDQGLIVAAVRSANQFAKVIDDVAVQPYVDPNLFGRQRGHRVWLAKTLKATKSPEFWVGRPSYRRRAYGSCDRSSLDLCADSIVNSLWN